MQDCIRDRDHELFQCSPGFGTSGIPSRGKTLKADSSSNLNPETPDLEFADNLVTLKETLGILLHVLSTRSMEFEPRGLNFS